MREYSLKRRANPSLDHILITMGGVDQNNATGQVLEALEASTLPANSRITVIMGPHAPWLKEIKRIATAMPWEVDVKVGVDNMGKLMADSDLAIGAAGSTAWERCCLGLPSLILVLAENQKKVAHTLANLEAMLLLLKNSDLPAIIDNILSDEFSLATLRDNSSRIVDGRGTERVVQEIFK
jgi:spore coat polysaccharide biosynthesis predicted glycosyltransferase SpsG